VMPHFKRAAAMKIARDFILANPATGRGLWRKQDEYYAGRAWNPDGEGVVVLNDPAAEGEARELLAGVCNGNADAALFCDIWYKYVHGIDDLVDTLVDGRPTLSKEQMIGLFLQAAMLFNSKFYREHQSMLLPIVVQITSTFADSVAWERSSKPHQRAMGDVFRTCGNEIFGMIAFITGGWDRMRAVSPRIKERDYLLQHDEHGNPK